MFRVRINIVDWNKDLNKINKEYDYNWWWR